jgi:hypothetical protein
VAALPAVRSFGSAYLADGAEGYGEPAAGDHLQAVYRFWLVGHQLGQGAAPWRDPYSFQPLVEPQVVLAGWPFGLPFWPLEAAAGPVVAWNTLLLATIVAAGLTTYGWLRELALPPLAAAAGGLAFAIAPYRLAQSGVHLLGWIAVLLPLALFAFERSRRADGGPRAHAWGALCAAALVSVPLSGQPHLALGIIPFVAVYAALRLAPLASLWAAAGLAGAVIAGFAIHFTVIRGSAEAGGRSLDQVALFSAEVADLASREQRGGLEQFVYVGWLLPLLAAIGAVLLWRGGARGLAGLLGVAAVVPPVLALGTHLPLYEWLWNAFPPLRYPRVPGRLMPIANLAFAGLAAVAVARLLAASGRHALAAGTAALALVAADLLVFPLRSSAADEGNAAYAALRAGPGGRLLELPLFEPGVHFGSVYDSYQLQAPRERPGGYSTLAPRATYDFFFRRNRISCGVWLPGDEELLRELGVEHVAFHRGMYRQGEVPGAWFGWRELVRRGFAPVARGGEVTLLARTDALVEAEAPAPEPPRTAPLFCEGWRGRVTSERQGPFWVYGEGALELEVSAAGETTVTLWVDGEVADETDILFSSETLTGDLGEEGWHAVVLEVPQLLPARPPEGVRLERIFVRR